LLDSFSFEGEVIPFSYILYGHLGFSPVCYSPRQARVAGDPVVRIFLNLDASSALPATGDININFFCRTILGKKFKDLG
jgi:hypothetical protein